MQSRNRSRSSNFLLNFLSQLSIACSELCLIIFLFITSTLSNLTTEFARYCKLQTPCFICSQLYRNPWFTGDSLCEAHKLEISSLSYCERHNKLGFGEEFCQTCHLSCSNSNVFESEKGDCSCCFRRRGNVQTGQTKSKEKVSEITDKRAFEMKSLIDLEGNGYCEVKTMSDSESESNPKFNNQVQNANVIREKVIQVNPIVKSNPLIGSHNKNIHLDESSEVASSKSGIGHGLEEINWIHFGTKTHYFSSTPQTVSPRTSLEESSKSKDYTSGTPPLEVSRRQTISDPCPPKRTPCHVSIKRVISSRVPVNSPRPSEIISSKDNLTTQEDIKNLFSQITPTPRVGLRPPPSPFFEESVNSKCLSVSVERNSSSLDSFEVNVVSDIEGESDVDKLRRQVALDRQNMSILYKELEEERNASAIAASEAMAMINRLQEEKAGIKMESLQYLRMLEEEEEYDKEAIKNLNDLLTEREKELLDLEAEIEEFKRDFLKFEHGLVLGYEERAFVFERLKWLEERVNREKLGVEMENEMNEEGFKKEVFRLYERFDRIEMDQRFISHAFGAIKEKGDEGIKFVEEIAEHLRELRKIGTGVKNQ